MCHALALSCARVNSARSMRHGSLTAAPPRPPRPRSLVHDAESKDAEPGFPRKHVQRVDAPAAKNTREERKGETSAECRARIFEPSSHYICIYIYIYTLFFLDFMFFTERERFFLASNTVCGFLREERVNLIHSSPIRSVRP